MLFPLNFASNLIFITHLFLRYKVGEIYGTKKGTYSYSFQYIFQRKVNKNREKRFISLSKICRDKHVKGLFFIN